MNVPVKKCGGNLPPLGSTEAAVQSCVSLIARMSKQPERIVCYWLDLYYQVRAVYEREQAAQVERGLRRDELLPALRALLQEVMGGVEGGREQQAENEAEYPAPPGEPEDTADPETAEPEEPPRMVGRQAAEFKRDQLARVERLRAEGVSLHQIFVACGKHPTPTELDRMLRREAVKFSCWRALGEALDRLEKERNAGSATE